MIVAALSALLGVAIALVRPALAKLIFLAWLAVFVILIGPLLLMPESDDLFGGSAAVGIALVVGALGLGWIVGRVIVKLTGRSLT